MKKRSGYTRLTGTHSRVAILASARAYIYDHVTSADSHGVEVTRAPGIVVTVIVLPV